MMFRFPRSYGLRTKIYSNGKLVEKQQVMEQRTVAEGAKVTRIQPQNERFHRLTAHSHPIQPSIYSAYSPDYGQTVGIQTESMCSATSTSPYFIGRTEGRMALKREYGVMRRLSSKYHLQNL